MRGTRSGERARGGAARMLVAAVTVLFGAACSAEIPKQWAALGMPAAGLLKVDGESDAHGFYADYAGASPEDAARLRAAVEDALLRRGYARACSALDGLVRGYAKDASKLAVKVDTLGGKLGLSVFTERGKEPLLHGVCFGSLKLGEPVRRR